MHAIARGLTAESVAAAFVRGSLAAVLSAPLTLRIAAHDEQFSDSRTDLVDLPCAEVVVAQVNAFDVPGRRDLANPDLHLQCETKVTCYVTKVTICGARSPLWTLRGAERARFVPVTGI